MENCLNSSTNYSDIYKQIQCLQSAGTTGYMGKLLLN